VIATRQECWPALPVERLWHRVELARGGYYRLAQGTPEEASAEAIRLRDAIERIVLAFPGYGDRQVTTASRERDGWTINPKRVLRISACRRALLTWPPCWMPPRVR